MNQSSLLVRLSSYRPRRGRESIEDFITEAFAWLLETNPAFATSFLNLVCQELERNDQSIAPMTGEGTAWNTQESSQDCRFDMVARDTDTLLVFEHKAYAAATNSQIKRYIEQTTRIAEGRETRVVMITANRTQWRENAANACLCWKDVYHLIDHFVGAEGVGSTANEPLKDVQQLLAYHGLGPDEPVSQQAVQVYPVARHLDRQLRDLFQHLGRLDWSFLNGIEPGRDESRFGRVGLGFREAKTKAWAPGLLVVSVLDGNDLRIDEQLDTGLKVHVVLSFEPCLHATYRAMTAYLKLMDLLRDYADTTDWEFDNQRDRSKKPNKYHPLLMSFPLLDLLRSQATIAEQAESVYAVVRPLLETLVDSGCLQELINECVPSVRNGGQVVER